MTLIKAPTMPEDVVLSGGSYDSPGYRMQESFCKSFTANNWHMSDMGFRIALVKKGAKINKKVTICGGSWVHTWDVLEPGHYVKQYQTNSLDCIGFRLCLRRKQKDEQIR